MNSTNDERITGRENLDEPHFDEEATVLAARPVVRLDEVKSEKRSKASVAIGLAIGGGLLVGLLAAALIYRYLGANQVPTGETNIVAEQPASPAGEPTANQLPSSAGGAVVGVDDPAVTSVQDEEPVETDTATREREPKLEESKPVKTQDRAPEAAPRRPVVVTESRPQADDDEEDKEAERAIKRAERQEERRERRRAERQANRQERRQNQTADDLTRIREIFEGSPKP